MVSMNGSVSSSTSGKRPKLVEESLRTRTPIYYFGLGSNMSRSKLESRSFDGSKIHVISMEPAVVHNYRLAFNFPGFLPLEPSMGGLERVPGCSDENDAAEKDRGKPSRPLYPYEKPECHGALILLSADDYEKMMHTEGVSGDRHEDNRGYEEFVVTAVPYDKSKSPVQAVALRPYPLSRLPHDAAPSPRYMKILRDGAAELGLSPCYQEFLAKHPVHTTPIWVQMIAFPNLVATMTLTFSRSRWKSRITRLQYKLMYLVYACPTSAYPLRLLSNVAHAILMVPGCVVGMGMLGYRRVTGRRLSPSVERFLFPPVKKAVAQLSSPQTSKVDGGQVEELRAPNCAEMKVPSEMEKLNDSFQSSYQGDDHHPRTGPRGGMGSMSKRTLEDYSRVTHYGELNTLQFLLQMYGSVWPYVFPWCVVVGLFTYGVYALKEHGIDLTIHNGSGHSFMSLLVSFLVVTRTSLIFNKFQHSRQILQNLFGACGEIVQHSSLLTMSNTNSEAKAWRSRVAFNAVISLRAAISALEFKSSHVPCWELLPPFDDGSELDLLLNTNTSGQPRSISALKDLAHGPRNAYTENFRVPTIWAYQLRKAILTARNDSTILRTSPLQTQEMLKILDFVTKFVHAWEEMHKLTSMPFPFPLAQMTRTFLFFWVFSLPLVLIKDDSSLWATFLVIFGITYGFFGLEHVALQLSDPYGQDENDFPASCWADIVAEDVYVTICKTDGYPAALALRNRISGVASGTAAPGSVV